MAIIHVWAEPSRWPSGLSHAVCSKNITPDFAILPSFTAEEIATCLRSYGGRLCRRCSGEKRFRSAR